MKPEKTRVSITLDAAVADRLRELARQDFRSLSGLVNRILKEHVTQPDKR